MEEAPSVKMADGSVLNTTCEGKNKREKLFCNLVYVVSVDAHASGKDVAYNAMERLWPQASAIHPSTLINFKKAKTGEGSCVASLPEIGLQEHDHRGAGT